MSVVTQITCFSESLFLWLNYSQIMNQFPFVVICFSMILGSPKSKKPLQYAVASSQNSGLKSPKKITIDMQAELKHIHTGKFPARVVNLVL